MCLPYLASGAQSKPASSACSLATTLEEEDYLRVSDAFSPAVSYAMRQDADGLSLTIRVGTFQADGRGATLSVGLSAGKILLLTEKDAVISHTSFEADYQFSLSKEKLGLKQPDLRFAFAVNWSGGPYGAVRLKEKFLQPRGPLQGNLSPDPADWTPINLAEEAKQVAAQHQRIWIDFQQPMDGKATLVLEDAQGKRIRNLISGESMTAGAHRIAWDGLDDEGHPVAAGTYQWRAIAHPGIKPRYLFSFYNHGDPPWQTAAPTSNWLADHSNAVTVASSGGRVYIGAPVAESGHNVVKTDTEGDPEGHLDFSVFGGVGKLFLLADDTGVYAVAEGTPWREPFQDRPGGRWTLRRPLSLLHWDLHEQPLRYQGSRGEKIVAENLYYGTGPHPQNFEVPAAHNLSGAAILNHKIYISLAVENRIVVLDGATGAQTGEIKLAKPGLLATDGDSLIGLSGGDVVRIEPGTGRVVRLFTPALSALPKIGDPEEELYGFVGMNPTGIAVDRSHTVYLSDNGIDQNVKVFNSAGHLLRQIGAKGGRPPQGAWTNDAVYRPHGIAVDDKNQLWVTETDNSPRRVSVWDALSGKYLHQYLGPAFYGAPGASFDPADHTRWIGGGALWSLDFKAKTAEPQSILFRQTAPGAMETMMMGMYWNFYHQDGRTFLISYGAGQSIYELNKDGSTRLWAICGTLASLAQLPRWTLPKAIADVPAVRALMDANAQSSKADPGATPFGPWKDKVSVDAKLLQNISILWVDKNGDGIGEPEEFEVLPAGDSFYTPGWGTGNPTLTLNIPAQIKGSYVVLHLKPEGFLPSGAPNYRLENAVKSAVPLDFRPTADGDGGNSIQDRFGREIFNTTPMRAVGVDGKTLWTFPNRWVGVHGSHGAPLPRSGELQGVLNFLGTAPLDDKGEVMVMNGNHGRFFAMTTDGMYLDEFFKDVRVSYATDAYRIGGEAFGGFFGRGDDGKYYLQSGHTDYRIFELDGLQQVKRFGGTVAINAAQANATLSRLQDTKAQMVQVKVATIPAIASEANVAGSPEQWPTNWKAIEWGDASQAVPIAQVKMLRSGDMLHLAYRVKDASPWKNNGSDWTQLFKTGDGIDFQFSTDAAADPNRSTPAAGDKRLLIAPFLQHSIAVLYSYHERNARSPMPFSSPSRTVYVDRVKELTNAIISVGVQDDSYTVTTAIPLAELGLPGPQVEVQLHGDFGVIYGDPAGTVDQLRSYWSNKETGLLNDVPGEVTVTPRLWGVLKFERSKP